MADCACEATSASGIGVGNGFVGLGFDGAAEDCWAAVFPLKTQQNMMNKPIRITLRIRVKSEFFLNSWNDRRSDVARCGETSNSGGKS